MISYIHASLYEYRVIIRDSLNDHELNRKNVYLCISRRSVYLNSTAEVIKMTKICVCDVSRIFFYRIAGLDDENSTTGDFALLLASSFCDLVYICMYILTF